MPLLPLARSPKRLHRSPKHPPQTPDAPKPRTGDEGIATSDDLLEDIDDDADAADTIEQAPSSQRDDFLDVRNSASDNFGIEVSEEDPPVGPDFELDPDIFRAYDIRGITDTNLTPEVVYWIGRAFASQAISQGQSQVVVGWDGRHSSETLQDSLTRGLTESGATVIKVGQVPTPLLYFATHSLETGTGHHDHGQPQSA